MKIGQLIVAYFVVFQEEILHWALYTPSANHSIAVNSQLLNRKTPMNRLELTLLYHYIILRLVCTYIRGVEYSIELEILPTLNLNKFQKKNISFATNFFFFTFTPFYNFFPTRPARKVRYGSETSPPPCIITCRLSIFKIYIVSSTSGSLMSMK